ncbi:MAG: rubrerythrin family protein [Oscillospiraceae bacterium]|jgi:rubrerythrin|nr:rubrerythrin family protein [Oscillospiraceae bacterium]
MSIEFENSQTKHNLMKAFSGESQAFNRYVFSASQAKKENLQVIESIFLFTANQEKEHAKVYYNLLKEFSGQKISISANYPVDNYNSTLELLKAAQNNEYEEYKHDYSNFARIAKEEGFNKISSKFNTISKIEKTHSDRFKYFADLLKENKLFISNIETEWMCLNCGEVYKGLSAPKVCPSCEHNQGFFISLELAPFTASSLLKPALFVS